jgi:hypothetical protein
MDADLVHACRVPPNVVLTRAPQRGCHQAAPVHARAVQRPAGALPARRRPARAELLHVLVELGAWLAWYRRTNGAYPHHQCLPPSLTPPPDTFAFVSLAQCRCTGRETPAYMSGLAFLVLTGSDRALDAPLDALQSLLRSARERGLFGFAELADAARVLILSPCGTLDELEENADDAFLANALVFVLRAAGTQLEANTTFDVFRVLAQVRCSGAAMAEHALRRARGLMTLDAAYRALGATDTAEDEKLVLSAHMDVCGACVLAQTLC